MIIDRLENITQYCGISPNLDIAIAYAQTNAMTLRGDAPVDLDEQAGYAFSTHYATEPEASRRYEVHRRYIDLQIMQEGSEHCRVAHIQQFPERGDYKPDDDLQFLNGTPDSHVAFDLRPGIFAIFFPHDAHKPSCNLPECASVTKCVIKIAIDTKA
jgi:YhcH/YjgK/YiaL family protein